MQIHVVSQNQTLAGIAQAYSTTAQDITEANELPDSGQLVVGQALVIPIIGSFYWVQPGDSLWSIAQRFNITYQELAAINRLSVNQPLSIGLRLYIPPQRKTERRFIGYVEPRGTEVTAALENSVREAAPYLSYLALFSYQAKRDGSLQAPLLNQFPAIAEANRVGLMMVITNIEEGAFSDELASVLLTNEEIRNTFIDNIISTAREQGFTDIHFDFEFLRPADREAYNQFLRIVKERISAEGWLLSTALAPKTSAAQTGQWYEAHDYRAHGEIADFVVLMTYEWGYSGGPAMAVSPIGPVTNVVNYALTEMPATKIIMGQNLYGYDWTLPFVPGTTARAISPQQAIRLAAEHNVAIQYDSTAQAPFFHYTDTEGRQHEVWFEDARSIQAKFNLIKRLNLRGMAYWKLGLSFPQNWLLLSDNFTVEKQ
ncbi:glycoside hydrolase family 18 protein [Bacillaceae bacterium Marseille-Q3522]|nr:glycoside hydrolase family 18 protein [Bacillaceae bacterium Marseille-Q3522]